ncbi:LPXTG cell wall anchor domain-containing protein [Lachnospiraceae bacterium OttesenSCG-928-D06]|nr:LPXTG cell wall anchor domain-containing protein [Lachnospiraceae bacterium OttesenSCG-928-D06]
MKNWKKRTARVMAAVISLTMMLSATLSVSAWELSGESTVDNQIKTKEPSSLITTIQTNYHAFGCTGFVVLTQSTTVDSILEITQEQYNAEGRGIIYIANKPYEEGAAALIQAEVDKIKGEVLWYYDILLFKYADDWNQPKHVISAPLKMAIGILDSDRDSSYDYAMVSLYDNNVTILPDLDTDDYTITFESQYFQTYAMIRYPKGTSLSDASVNIQPTSVAEVSVQNTEMDADVPKVAEDEWDEVPKTGEQSDSFLSLLLGLGCFFILTGLIYDKKKNYIESQRKNFVSK